MHVEGMANIRVCANNIQATLRVAVSSELKENMLISCDDLRKLRVIPADFPNTVLAANQTNRLAQLKMKLMQKFDKTLSDDLNPEPMKCTPMSIAVTFADCYLRANIEFRNKACTRGKYYS